eukprot:16084-Pleurochrysis_carterae.AAC.3
MQSATVLKSSAVSSAACEAAAAKAQLLLERRNVLASVRSSALRFVCAVAYDGTDFCGWQVHRRRWILPATSCTEQKSTSDFEPCAVLQPSTYARVSSLPSAARAAVEKDMCDGS